MKSQRWNDDVDAVEEDAGYRDKTNHIEKCNYFGYYLAYARLFA